MRTLAASAFKKCGMENLDSVVVCHHFVSRVVVVVEEFNSCVPIRMPRIRRNNTTNMRPSYPPTYTIIGSPLSTTHVCSSLGSKRSDNAKTSKIRKLRGEGRLHDQRFQGNISVDDCCLVCASTVAA